MKKRKHTKKLSLLVIILSLFLNVFCFPASAQEISIDNFEDVLMYHGSIDDLPKHIYEAYKENPKAESLDIYDTDIYSITTNNSDGTKTIEIYQTPIKYIEENKIKFIDTSITKSSSLDKLITDKSYECIGTPVKSYFPNTLSNGISIEKDDYSIKCYFNR